MVKKKGGGGKEMKVKERTTLSEKEIERDTQLYSERDRERQSESERERLIDRPRESDR